ncbi:MAG: hypothetical protein IH851_09515 [Armatimonadetes bacterium]|nr:hypothetical protein [Armatimonadota bacterium]
MKSFSSMVALGALSTAGFVLLASAQSGDDTWHPLPRMKKAPAQPSKPPMSRAEFEEYTRTIRMTAQMVGNAGAQRLARAHGLNILNITWEDTGRFKNSAVGPNISDMTIQVGVEDPRTGQFGVTAMPVIRFPNFSDITADLDPRDFTLLVGNEKGRNLKRISLYEFLADPTAYLTNAGSWLGRNRSLLAARDSKVLVSAQACFLPVPKKGIATFNPVLFNYQSVSGDPAVLTVLVTREGTSVTVIDNKRDAFRTGFIWGQRLFHNDNGMRASLTGERLSDYKAGIERPGKTGPEVRKRDDSGLNMVLLIQIPLKQKHPMRGGFGGGFPAAAGEAADVGLLKERRSDVENAVIGHGDLEGPFTEIDNLAIERDPRFPVRVTVQFYKATSNGVVSEADMRAIKGQIDRVYSLSDSVGSLVTGGRTGRVTEYHGMKVQPPGWWDEFWRRHERNTGDTRWEAIAKLRALIGKNYTYRPVCDLYLRDLLREPAK